MDNLRSSILKALDTLLERYKALESENIALKKELKAIKKAQKDKPKKVKKSSSKKEDKRENPSLF